MCICACSYVCAKTLFRAMMRVVQPRRKRPTGGTLTLMHLSDDNLRLLFDLIDLPLALKLTCHSLQLRVRRLVRHLHSGEVVVEHDRKIIAVHNEQWVKHSPMEGTRKIPLCAIKRYSVSVP